MNWYEIALGVVLVVVSLLIIVLPSRRSRRVRACPALSWAKALLRWLPAVSAAWTPSWLS